MYRYIYTHICIYIRQYVYTVYTYICIYDINRLRVNLMLCQIVFMEADRSLLDTQVPATCLYPKSAQSSPYPHMALPEEPFNILPSMPGSPKQSLSLMFPHQTHIHASLLPNPRYMLRPSHSYIYIKRSNTNIHNAKEVVYRGLNLKIQLPRLTRRHRKHLLIWTRTYTYHCPQYIRNKVPDVRQGLF
jgi:hypothetical protein